jgi:D-lactate dehydrogenase
MKNLSAAVPSRSTLFDALSEIVEPRRVLTRPIDLIAFASDASFYRLIPKAVVLARGSSEIQALFRFSHERRIPLTFRAAGTSLSGQAITDGILVEVARHWRTVTIEAGGKKVRVEPGVIGGHVNRLLAAYGAKIGPDPASINACMMGGILANNSSGMCCGVGQNAYHTLSSLSFVLPSGTLIDTADASADELFHAREPKLADGLLQLRKEICESPALYERIRRKYQTKNTTGYSLNAFIDFERSVDIFAHLLVGSEGTLAFIAEARLNTVPDLPVKYTGVLLFPDLATACAAIRPLRDRGAQAIELMDRAALRSVEDQTGSPPALRRLSGESAGLLVEFQAAEEAERPLVESRASEAIDGLELLPDSPGFTHAPEQQALLWKIRKGMFPSVGAVRKRGTSVILEDVVFPVDRLAAAALDLRKLFSKHGYEDAILFGHAKDGNLHFVISQSFGTQQEIDRYRGFIEEVVPLVVERYDGALKGEHGTGRNMAPFVEAEWGPEACAIMRRLKQLSDPLDLLNPGVILNPDPRADVRHLKTLPAVEEEVDKCIECGYCEIRCPSRDLTLTPRQRIIVRRELKRLEGGSAADLETAQALETDFSYMVLDTCAVDGMCALSCPVGIDTGTLTKRFRQQRHSQRAQRTALGLARRFGWMERGVRLALRAGHLGQSIGGAGFVNRFVDGARKLSRLPLPQWMSDLPEPASHRLPPGDRAGARAVYFPSCISRTMGPLPGEFPPMSVAQAAILLASRAEFPVFIPPDVRGCCCGVPFSSKGYDQAHRFAVNRIVDRFWDWSDAGRLPVVVDTTPCTYGILACRGLLSPQAQKRFDAIRIVDCVAFAHDDLLPRLKVNHKLRSVALHPACSLVKMNLTAKLEAIARACSQEVFIPPSSGCCGFAGDRGLLVPELTSEATRQQAAEIREQSFEGYFSSSRTCELGMSRAVGETYRSFLYLLEQATRPR